MKCGNSAFNAQGSRGIIVAAQVGAVKSYVAAMSFTPLGMLMSLFVGF
jgi:hypothetical protein